MEPRALGPAAAQGDATFSVRTHARGDFSAINTTRGGTSSKTGSCHLDPATPAKQRRSAAHSADLFTLSPIAEAESFSLKMPESPLPQTSPHQHRYGQQQHASATPMEIDSTTPSRTAQYPPQPQQRLGHGHQQHHPNSRPSDAKRPLLSVFDWDDTLCPSWWLYRNGVLSSHGLVHESAPTKPGIHPTSSRFYRPVAPSNNNAACISERDRQRFTQLEDRMISLLQLAMQMGPVFIITAATLQWVELCAHHFLPRVKLLLKQRSDKVHVVSAREWYQQHARREGDPMTWKSATFDALCAHLQLEKVSRRLQHRVDFVSIGDSVFERDACREMEQKAPAIVHSKTLKFVDHPSLQELLDQVAMTSAIYERIRSHEGSLDLHIMRNSVRQKGDPTLKLVQVDLPNQHSHLAPPAAAQNGAYEFVEPTSRAAHNTSHQAETRSRILTSL
ncbi:hypothetical protein Gpo141_00009643 [Globisporangium polare]